MTDERFETYASFLAIVAIVAAYLAVRTL